MLRRSGRARVLMIAFACDPEGGGEHWLGWGWAIQAAKSHDVTLLTWDRFASGIARHAPEAGISPVVVGVPGWVNRIGDRGGAGRWFRQLIWHRRAIRVTEQLHRAQAFNLVHQTTFHTFRIPFRAADLGVPAVWGPIAGGEATPPGFGPWLGRLRSVELLRGPANHLALAQPRVQRSLRKARAIFTSNRTTLNFLPDWCRSRCTVMPPNALREIPPPPPPRVRAPDAPLELLFAGNCVATRSIPLVLEALGQVPELPWRLTVAGGGSALGDWKALVARMGLANRVSFMGVVPRATLAGMYERADVFVFPALRDSGGSGLLEAMSSGLPVVCCDWGGPAEMVVAETGIKVSVASPEAAIAGFATAFQQLHREPAWRATVGRNAWERARGEFTWDRKRTMLEATYTACLGATR